MSLSTSPTRILLAQELASVLGLPRYTIHAVLTLTPDDLPTLELTTLVTDDLGRPVVEPDPDHHASSKVERLATVMRKFKLVPIEE